MSPTRRYPLRYLNFGRALRRALGRRSVALALAGACALACAAAFVAWALGRIELAGDLTGLGLAGAVALAVVAHWAGRRQDRG